MKLAITGKGGVGKTTISALIADAMRRRGRNVVAIDADPDSNLLACMGHPAPESVRPLVELNDLIEKRTGVKPGAVGGMYKLNPRVDDIPEKYAVEVNGVKVLVAGAVKKGGAGCYCPENALVRALVSHLLLDENTDLVLDMEAGVEHLGRGTVSAVDCLLVVVEPGMRSMETAERIRRMAKDLGIVKIAAIGNKIRGGSEKTLLQKAMVSIPFVGFVPYEEKLRAADLGGRPAAGASEAVDTAISRIVKKLCGSSRR